MSAADSTSSMRAPSTARRRLGLTLLGVVLALSFLAYLSPDMQLQWETLAALCGF